MTAEPPSQIPPTPARTVSGRKVILGTGGLIFIAVAAFAILQATIGYAAMSGPLSLAVEPHDTHEYTALRLNETDVREHAPLLADLLDEATTTNTPVRSGERPGAPDAVAYLEAQAHAAGVQNFRAAPIKGLVNWGDGDGRTFEILYLRG